MTRARLPLIAVVLAGVLALAVGSAMGSGAPRAAAKATSPAKASSPTVGIGDEQPTMFHNTAYVALHAHIARYVTPYDVMSNRSANDLPRLKAWLAGAKRLHVEPFVAFYHSDKTPKKLPSVAAYTSQVKKFLKAFPQVKLLQPWNEANRGNVRESGNGSYSSPSATQSADYYLALRHACSKCTIVGLDVLDSTNVASTIRYINAFKARVGHRGLPSIWGLHNYSDTNRFRTTATRAVLSDTSGQIWLTETGGIAKLSTSFPFNLSRQARATSYMFTLAGLSRRITRLYVFQWTGGRASRERFDAGLTDAHSKVRPAYCVIYEHMLHKRSCPYRTVKD